MAEQAEPLRLMKSEQGFSWVGRCQFGPATEQENQTKSNGKGRNLVRGEFTNCSKKPKVSPGLS